MSALLDSYLSPTPVLSYSPVVLPVPGRPVDLQLRVTVPATGGKLPVVVLSSGQGRSHHLNSLNGYAPLVNIWAAQGFAVLQPTHLSAGVLKHVPALAGAPGAPFFYRSRAEDVSRVIDALDVIETTVPGLAGRLDRHSIAVAGHSLGGFAAELLLGARMHDPGTGELVDLKDPRITQGVLLAAAGRGGDIFDGPMGSAVAIFRDKDLSTMTTPALVVAGDADVPAHFTTQVGAEWYADAYHLSPGPKSLLTVYGGEHVLGGISGYDAAETTDADPERVAAVALLSAAYLRSAFRGGDDFARAAEAYAAFGRVESKE